MPLPYRPEVDGLRALAVMIVIFHHLNIPGFAGGYIGVDIFFVISGYLITSIILSENKSGNFSFGEFYKRRVIRLAPAYFLVIFTTFIAALLLMLPNEAVAVAESALYSTFFLANLYFWQTVGGYFGSGADTAPLLHLWSLAVEEQFYIFWPIALIVLHRLFFHKLALVILLLIIAGLVGSEWWATSHSASAYYLMPPRAFELLLGALIACLPAQRLQRIPALLQATLAIIGTGLILYSNASLTEEAIFPGVNALYPSLGTFLLIAFLKPDTPGLGRLFTHRLCVYIGKISYPAYLWHWPIIAFLNLYLIELSLPIAVLTTLATLGLAALTHELMEKPARRYRSRSWARVVTLGFASPALVSIVLSVGVTQAGGFPDRINADIQRRSDAIRSEPHEIRGDCHSTWTPSDLPPATECLLGARKPEVDLLLVGDSHANHFAGMIDVLAKDAGLRGYDLTQSVTPFLLGIELFLKKDDRLLLDEKFAIRNRLLEEKIAEEHYKYVVLAGSFYSILGESYFSKDKKIVPDQRTPDLFKQSLVETLTFIVEQGSTPVLVLGNPRLPTDLSHCTLNNARFGTHTQCSFASIKREKRFIQWQALVDELKARFETLVIIDPTKVICDETACYTELDGIPLYRDKGHLNHLGSRKVGQEYLARYHNPLAGPQE